MPRRSPGEIRAQLPYRINYGSRTVIRSLSASANRQIRDFERNNALYPGEIARAFGVWSCMPRRSSEEVIYGHGNGTTAWRDMHCRTLLEAAIGSMRTKARRELSSLIEPLDALHIARTANDFLAPADLPWWRCRIWI